MTQETLNIAIDLQREIKDIKSNIGLLENADEATLNLCFSTKNRPVYIRIPAPLNEKILKEVKDSLEEDLNCVELQFKDL